MQRICIPLITFGMIFVLSISVQGQQSEWIPPLPMQVESLIAPNQNYSYSNGNGFVPAFRQPVIGRFASMRPMGRIPVPVDSNYGYGNWRYNYNYSASTPQYSFPVTEGYDSHSSSPVIAPVSAGFPQNQEVPSAGSQMTGDSSRIDLPVIVPPKSTAAPQIIVPPTKPRKLESEPDKIIRPRKVSEFPPQVRIPPRTVIDAVEDAVPPVKVPDAFITVEEPETEENVPVETEEDPFGF